MGLAERSKTQAIHLSGGEKRKIGLAMALVGEPELVFLDEPTTGLDPKARRDLWGLINGIRAKGHTVFLTTHYLDEAEHCQRIAIIQAGKLAAHGTVDELKAIFKSRPILEVRAADAVRAMRTLEAMPEVEKTSIFGTAVHAVLRSDAIGPDAVKAGLETEGIAVLSCGIVAPSLEDVFLDVAERSAA